MCVTTTTPHLPSSGWMSLLSAPLLSISGLITKSPDDTRAQGRCFLGSVSLYTTSRLPHPPIHLHSDLCPPNFPLSSIQMSSTDQTAGLSTDNFTAIFNVASTEYQTVTGNRLDTHPLAAQLNTCHSSEDVSDVLRTQAHAFSKFRRGDEKLMTWLDPIVHILFTSSATLGEGIGLVSLLMHSV